MFDKIYIEKLKSNFSEAIRVILTNKVRTLLTSLGIIFGVGAVIAMLAIGTGAKQSILDQMKLIGTNNIVVKSIISSDEEGESNNQTQGKKEKKPWSPGLTIKDVNAISRTVPTIEEISPEIVLPLNINLVLYY